MSAFSEGLHEAGFSTDRNVVILNRWAEGHDGVLPNLAVDLVQQGAAVIVVGENDASLVAAKAAAGRIPIVFVSGSDPVHGRILSPDHPAGNITGISMTAPELLASRFDFLHQLTPKFLTLAVDIFTVPSD